MECRPSPQQQRQQALPFSCLLQQYLAQNSEWCAGHHPSSRPTCSALQPPAAAVLTFLLRTASGVQEMQDSSPAAGPTRRRAALTVGQWTPSLAQQERPRAYEASLLLMRSPDFVIRMAGVSLLSVRAGRTAPLWQLQLVEGLKCLP